MTAHQDCEEAHPGQPHAGNAPPCHKGKHSAKASTVCSGAEGHGHTGHDHTDHDGRAEGDGCESDCAKPDPCHAD